MTNHVSRGADDPVDVAIRVRRAMLIGALASFVGFFGLTVVATSPSQAVERNGANNGVTIVCTSDVCAPIRTNVRTRTS